MPEAVLGLGGNLGARRSIFGAAGALLAATKGCRVLARSKLYETPPLGPPQPDYLNAALRVSWEGDATELLIATQRIEQQLGRERRERWGARTLDLDLLHWSEGPVQTAGLEVPHRELANRPFALAPLLDVAPELELPWSARLHELGGPPAEATPGWPTESREGEDLCTGVHREETELAAQLVALVCATLPGERFAEASRGGRGLSTHAFTGPAELFDAEGRSWLVAAVNDALRRGFLVQQAAIFSRDEVHAAGVLVGFEGQPSAALGPHELQLERQAARALRLKMRLDAPERGFDYKESGTM